MKKITDTARKVYQVYLERARKGMTAPSNFDISNTLGIPQGSLSMINRHLAEAGLIKQSFSGGKRVVHLPKYGISTARPPRRGKPITPQITDEYSRAATILRSRYGAVYNESVVGGSKDFYVVDRRRVSKSKLIKMAHDIERKRAA